MLYRINDADMTVTVLAGGSTFGHLPHRLDGPSLRSVSPAPGSAVPVSVRRASSDSPGIGHLVAVVQVEGWLQVELLPHRSACTSPTLATRSGTVAMVQSPGWVWPTSPTSGEWTPGVRARAYGEGTGDRAVAGVLVVVEEDPFAAVLLPPFNGDKVRGLAGHLAADPDGGMTHVDEVPTRFDRDEDVGPRPPDVFGQPCIPSSSGSRARSRTPPPRHRSPSRVAGLDQAQFIRVVHVGRGHRPGWNTIVPRLAHHTMTAGSVGVISSAVRPDGNAIWALWTQSGACEGMRFW